MPPDGELDPVALQEENARLKADLQAARQQAAEESRRADGLDTQVSQTTAQAVSARVAQFAAQETSAENTLLSLNQHIHDLKRQKAVLQAEGKFEEAAEVDEKLGDATARRVQAQQAKEYFANQKTTAASAPTDPVDQFLAANQGVFTQEDINWIRAHPRYARDGNFRQRVIKAHEEAASLNIRQRSPEYYAHLERRGYMQPEQPAPQQQSSQQQETNTPAATASPAANEGGESAPTGYAGGDATSNTSEGDGPEIIIRDRPMPQNAQDNGPAFNRRAENPQPRAAGAGSMRAAIAASPTRRSMSDTPGRRTIIEMTQEDRDAAMAFAPHGMDPKVLEGGEPAILQEWDRLRNSGAARRIAREWEQRRA